MEPQGPTYSPYLQTLHYLVRPDAFVAWFEGLRDWAPGQGDPLFPWLAAKEVKAAAGEWRRAPKSAFARLDRARALNPLSDRADVISGAIASRLGRTELMAESFRKALDRNDDNWYSQLELAVTEARLGRRADALRHLRLAAELDPREPTIGLVRSRVVRGEDVDTAALDAIFLRRTLVSNRADGP